MEVTQVPVIYDDLIDYFAAHTSPQEILAFQASEKAEERVSELLERNNAGTLTLRERAELEQIAHFNQRFTLLKAKALIALKSST